MLQSVLLIGGFSGTKNNGVIGFPGPLLNSRPSGSSDSAVGAMHVSILALQPILKASALPPLEVDAAINPLDALLDSTLCSWRG